MAEKPSAPNRLSMEIDPEAINEIVKATVNANIAVALQKSGMDFSGKVVEAILDARVDREGKILQKGAYDYNRSSQSWFDHQIENMLRECAKKALTQFMEAQAPKIQTAMLAAFKQRTPQIVKALTDGTMKAFTDKWGFSFKVDISRQE